ncbi:piggyBac transposable element-derived protein 3-like [Acyrthosiphon pisum]|uniref:PiggyBac transposable element-derived protein domain-containing protein n=1 Tax=Acyrthosiphon pisum TaxID=7029 RepID=A0A8R2BBD5_ACYPI|nr:piggyBac transposable element-derived protein 3-like [Acyrthosiphon pisum]|eukprot:XP_008189593.1 PREDICTED: piggyBac transposable element-derived protein 3-like [Acyrthosiphon pisum]
MALNEEQILDLLNDGYNSDIDILEENDDCDDELEILLQNFENDDLLGYLEALREEEDQLQVNEDIDETHEITAPNHTPGTLGLNFVQKKDIEWINTPCNAPILELNDLVVVDPPIDMPTPIEYFMNNNFKPTSATEIKSLIAIQMIMGCLKYPKKEMYWTRKYRVNIIADTMTKNRFFSLRQHIHLINNLDIPRNNKDKFVKVRPIFDTLNIRCQQLPVERNLSVDEQIVPFKGKLSVKQYMKGKPNPWGIKIFLLCGESGIVYNMILYQGMSTNINEELQKNFGLGGAIVVCLTQNISENRHFLYFDNFFSSYNLFYALLQKKIYAAGTVRLNRFFKPPMMPDKQISNLGRGTSFEITSKLGISLLKWFDNKPINIGSNFITSGTPEYVKRWDKKNKEFVHIERPEVIKLYNKSMGGVDKHDQLVSYYRMHMKSKKWTLRMIFHAFDMAVSNCWLEYINDANELKIPKNRQLALLDFKSSLAEELILVGRPTPPRKRGRPSSASPSVSNVDMYDISPKCAKSLEFRPLLAVSQDQTSHYPKYDGKKEATRCKENKCTGKTHVVCRKCNIHLCFTPKKDCFYNFHNKI